MGEPGDEGDDARTPLERYRRLEHIALAEFPDLVESTRIEREPGDTAKNLRVFLRDGSFLDVWISDGKYSYHWQGDEIVRFDCAPHHDVETFPHHVHVGDEIRESPLDGVPSRDLRRVLDELDGTWVSK